VKIQKRGAAQHQTWLAVWRGTPPNILSGFRRLHSAATDFWRGCVPIGVWISYRLAFTLRLRRLLRLALACSRPTDSFTSPTRRSTRPSCLSQLAELSKTAARQGAERL